MVALLEHLRANGHTRVESTQQAGRIWTDHLADLAAHTLFAQADSWYMSANVPGKPRQLLNYPATDVYLEFLATCAANGYDGFELS